jgi:molecular chaperone GrpE
MVNEHEHTEADIEADVTNEAAPDPELSDIEDSAATKIQEQRKKITRLEAEKQTLQDDLQRAKADFLNARKRLEEERQRDRTRIMKEHATALLPLCDSFQMAMHNTETWEKADAAWRKGVEGIYTQLLRLLGEYGVRQFDPTDEPFDPHRHEAIGTVLVSDDTKQDTVVNAVQLGYEITVDGNTEVLRPARVTTGVVADKNS